MRKKKIFFKVVLIIGILFLISVGYILYRAGIFDMFISENSFLDKLLPARVKIETEFYGSDINNNGKDDLLDIVEGARKEVDNKVTYISKYYEGGYPPDTEGVCTDLVWRALKNAGVNIKDDMDKDIAKNIVDYKEGVIKADPNIDFRRVKNQKVYFKKYYEELTTEIDVDDIENLKQWQPGDIIVKRNEEHVAILSDRRGRNGVPYVLHNAYNHATEDNYLLEWHRTGKIEGHYRLKIN